MAKEKEPVLLRLWHFLKRCHHGFWRWFKGLYKGRPWYVKIISFLGTLFVIFILYILAVAFNFLWLFGKSPSLSSIMNPKTNQASYIYSADGELIGKYYDENRTPVKYEEVTPTFFTALIDTEDERFYSHHGVDIGGVFAAIKDYIVEGKARGASTLTQQLVKNMFKVRTEYSTGLLGKIPGFGIVIMKTKEWIIATEIELFYSKKEILTMYANTVDFGNSAFGIKTAARTYFGTSPDSLTTDQCAILVGMLKATTTYSPVQHPDACKSRRNVVLKNMVDHNHLSQVAYDSLSRLPIDMSKFKRENPYQGEAQYFRQALLKQMAPWCEANGVDFYRDGLKIYTTLDMRMQRYAEHAVTQQMRQVQQNFENHWGNQPCWTDDKGKEIDGFIEDIATRTNAYKQLVARFPNDYDSVEYYMNQPHKVHLFDYDGGHDAMISSMDSIRYMVRFMHAAFVAIDPTNGYVKAWVGDVDFKTWNYDKVTSSRQPGSTFKLFVYAAAMERGLTPCDRRADADVSLQMFNSKTSVIDDWHPHNSNGRVSGQMMTLRSAFARSVNTVAVRVACEAGLANVAQAARDMGITTPLEETPALSLGASDVTLLDLTNAYSTVANYGIAHPPVFVTRITRTDEKGNEVEIYNIQQNKKENRVITPRTAFYLQQMLMAGTTDPGGTSMALNNYVSDVTTAFSGGTTDFGGKTGTSNNHSDAWFIGVSPHLVAGAWVGGEYRSIHFRTAALGQGSRTALPICGEFFKRVFADATLKQSLQGKFRILPLPVRDYRCQAPEVPLDTAEIDISMDDDSVPYEPYEVPELVDPVEAISPQEM